MEVLEVEACSGIAAHEAGLVVCLTERLPGTATPACNCLDR